MDVAGLLSQALEGINQALITRKGQSTFVFLVEGMF